jgi:hypothetical protein
MPLNREPEDSSSPPVRLKTPPWVGRTIPELPLVINGAAVPCWLKPCAIPSRSASPINQLEVWALDPDGNRTRRWEVLPAGTNSYIQTGGPDGSLWYEFVIRP